MNMDATNNKKNKVNFYDIVNNPDYYERTEDGQAKDFFICIDCGYIPKSKIDIEQTKFLDMHCKCGAPAILATFSLEELDFMEHDRMESLKYGRLCEAALSEAFGE
jgi:hypothetical protein